MCSVCAKESMAVIVKQIRSEAESPTVQYSTTRSDDASARL